MRKTPTRPVGDDTGRALATRQWLHHMTGRHIDVIARRCAPVACDVRNRSLLYDVDDAERLLSERSRTHNAVR